MADIFLSYAKLDLERVKPIVAFLESNGYSVWWDAKIPVSETWSSVIERELGEAACAVVVWSVNSVKSEWVEIEAGKAKAKKMYVPLMIDDVADKVPLEFSRIEAARFIEFDEHPENAEIELLLDAIHAAKNRKLQAAGGEALEKPAVIAPKLSFWKKWKTKLTVAAAIVGVLLLIVNTLAAFRPAKGHVQNQSAENTPRFEFMYLSLEGTYDMADTNLLDPSIKLFLNYPVIANEIVPLDDSLTTALFNNYPARTTYLLVENRSKVAVTEVELQMQQYIIRDTGLIKETAGKLVGDYEQQLARQADSAYPYKIELPLSLEPGTGVLVPIYETVKERSSGNWIFTSRHVCLPKKLVYKNVVTGEVMETPVRKMAAPVVFRGGVEGRG